MFLHLYQIFSSLQGHLHFFVHFFFTFMEHFFIGHPIRTIIAGKRPITTSLDPVAKFWALNGDP